MTSMIMLVKIIEMLLTIVIVIMIVVVVVLEAVVVEVANDCHRHNSWIMMIHGAILYTEVQNTTDGRNVRKSRDYSINFTRRFAYRWCASCPQWPNSKNVEDHFYRGWEIRTTQTKSQMFSIIWGSADWTAHMDVMSFIQHPFALVFGDIHMCCVLYHVPTLE